MGDLTPHFSRIEYACQCGCGIDTVDIALPWVSEFIRAVDGAGSTKILSGCRCPLHNAAVGGSPNSYHMRFQAADHECQNPQKVYKALCNQYPGIYGFGLYNWGVHADVRTAGPARWEEV